MEKEKGLKPISDYKHDYQLHINGLKGIKPYLQQLMLTTNYEGMGETDAKEIGETIDLAIKALEMRMPKKAYDVNREMKSFDCPSCLSSLYSENELENVGYCCVCGQALDWSDVSEN